MDNNLKKLIHWAQRDLTHFVSLIDEGSAAAGDPFQEGYSDHDINIIVSEDAESESQAIYEFLKVNPLGDTYLVSLRLVNDFLIGDSLNDLSLKFRSKTLAGKELIEAKSRPSQKVALINGIQGLTFLKIRYQRRLFNLSHWSEEYAKEKNYELFKNFFVFCSAIEYGNTGTYPSTRASLVETIEKRQDAKTLLAVTNDISNATKLKQKDAFEAAFRLIDEILSVQNHNE